MNLSVVVQVATAALVCYVIISLVEHQAHRHVMHRRRFPASLYARFPYLLRVFEAHAIEHHARYYREFDFEPDPLGKEHNLEISPGATALMFAAYLPLWLVMLRYTPLTAFMLLGLHLLHDCLWNVMHRQMHVPQEAWFRNTPAFQFLARYHFMHHRQPGRNFNVVCPLADYVLGTLARPTLGDIRAMLILGHLRPRTQRSRERIRGYQLAIAAQRHELLAVGAWTDGHPRDEQTV